MRKIFTRLLACFALGACLLTGAACAGTGISGCNGCADISTNGCAVVSNSSSIDVNIKDAENRLKDKGYDVEIRYTEDDTYYGVKGVVKKVLYAEKGELEISIFEFDKQSMAQAYYEYEILEECRMEVECMEKQVELYETALKEYRDTMKSTEIAKMEDSIKELKKEIEESKEYEKCMGVSGSCLWYVSHVDAIEDLK